MRIEVDQAQDETLVGPSLLGGPWLAGRRYVWTKDATGRLHLRHARLTEEKP